MAVLPIVQKEDAVLRRYAKAVPEELFNTPELERILKDMADSLDSQKDGVAIAAPQVGISYRIFLVRYDRMKPSPAEGEPERKPDVGVYINPDFVKLSKKSALMDEGCLSVRDIYGKTKRRTQATVKAKDAAGNHFERGGGGILAQAFQHEIDHLDGVLFIDHATDLAEIKDEDREEARAARRARREAAGDYDA